MSSEDGDTCEVNLHMMPLRENRALHDMILKDNDSEGILLPSWMQHWAVIFLWRDTDKCLRFEALVENDELEGKVREMDLQEGELQPGTKVRCGKYPLTPQHVKDVAATVATTPSGDDAVGNFCHTKAKQLLDKLGIWPSVKTALKEFGEYVLALAKGLDNEADSDSE